ncbi:hypothetical protein [Streptomyces sp. NPDC086777]|uniref:hypothetical protein n=1 Tax=Streptomyces sp. NPDC086777 TaxID=3154866 RepID=UPI00344D54F2
MVRRNIDPTSAAEVFRPALQAELQERPYAFDIQVQLCTDLERMPVDDLTVEWPEKLSPSVTVARLRLPQQDISSPVHTGAAFVQHVHGPAPSLTNGQAVRRSGRARVKQEF